MRDLDSDLRALRDDLHASISRPDLAHVAERARQRTVRRRMQVGAVAAVLVVSAAVPVLRAFRVDDRPADRAPTTTARIYGVDFADSDHGFAIRSCGTDCAATLLATDDGGATWAERKLPPTEPGREYARMTLTVLGPDEAVLARPVRDVERYPAWVHTTDAGRTWSAVENFASAQPVAIPPNGKLRLVCAAEVPERCEIRVGVAVPNAGGGTAPVLSQPPLDDPTPGETATRAGKHWVVGRDPTTRAWAVAVTADGGASWSTSTLDVPGTPTPPATAPARSDGWSVVERNGVMYLTVVGAFGNAPNGLLAVFRSTDDGVSWTRTWRAEEGAGLAGVVGGPVATADGRLLIQSTTKGTLASTDGGRTFTRADRQLVGTVQWTRGGYLLTTDPNGGEFEMSVDGVGWRRMSIG